MLDLFQQCVTGASPEWLFLWHPLFLVGSVPNFKIQSLMASLKKSTNFSIIISLVGLVPSPNSVVGWLIAWDAEWYQYIIYHFGCNANDMCFDLYLFFLWKLWEYYYFISCSYRNRQCLMQTELAQSRMFYLLPQCIFGLPAGKGAICMCHNLWCMHMFGFSRYLSSSACDCFPCFEDYGKSIEHDYEDILKKII